MSSCEKSPAEMMAEMEGKPGSKGPAKRNIVWDCGIKGMRGKLGLTVKQVAVGADVKAPTVYAVENGTDPMLTTAVKLAKFFGKPIEEIWPSRSGVDE